MSRQEMPLPASPALLLSLAADEEDPVRREKLLLQAEEMSPQDLDVQKALLLLGDLPRRNPKKVDFSVIKCYLLHAFEHPEQHGEDEQRRMTRELFDHPRVHRCLALAENQQAFMQDYLSSLCREYLHVFIEGQREHTGGWLGFQWIGRRVKALALPCADMVRNMLLSPFMSEEECRLLLGVFYRECLSFLGDARALDSLLGDGICRQIR